VKEGIHPKYNEVEVRCACGNTFKTRSTKPELHLEICSACHPFFTGRQKLIDTEGRVERFTKRFGAQSVEAMKTAAKATKAAKTAKARRKRSAPARKPGEHARDQSADPTKNSKPRSSRRVHKERILETFVCLRGSSRASCCALRRGCFCRALSPGTGPRSSCASTG